MARPNNPNRNPMKMLGSANGRALITEDQVIKMRGLWATKKYTIATLAERFSISHGAAKKVLSRETWRHL